MQNQEIERRTAVGKMNKRRETMPDGERYIIYYDFEKAEGEPLKSAKVEENENV